MTKKLVPGASSMSDVLDRVLDKGIVIDAEVNFEVAGLILVGVEARVVVASIETYLEYADLIAGIPPIAWKPHGSGDASPSMFLNLEHGPGQNRIAHYLDGLPEPPEPE